MNAEITKVLMKLATLPPIKEMIKSITQEQATEGMKILKRAYELMHPNMPDEDTVKNADQTAAGLITCVSACFLILMILMTLFGQRMKRVGIRWHVLNCSVWGLLHLAHNASFGDTSKAPWPGYIKDQQWVEAAKQVECFTRSVFPAGMIFVYIEQMILTCSPRLADRFCFNFIFALLLLPFQNIIMLFCLYAHWIDYQWWYEPIDFFNIVTFPLFILMSMVYLLFCFFGSCCCCYTATRRGPPKEGGKTLGTFTDMWLLLPYGWVGTYLYSPSFSLTMIPFTVDKLFDFIMNSGLMDIIMGGGGTNPDPGVTDTPGTGGEEADWMSLMLNVSTMSLNALPWFMLTFPIVHCVMALVCIRMYREQFFFMFTCGRVYEGNARSYGAQSQKNQPQPIQWANTTIRTEDKYPPPTYPTATMQQPIHIENIPTITMS
ncbi:hypothetical protein WR25_01689 isoform A [Diploscapter pachys]|uniref:Uncharacterized protein n=1 Tax=Diploscapter pachys TaxID=2018661 RepID=A0A2A2JSG2_9BILA|nr:hypothetical protein WR25_01689 isoform A [Diploscapter pachys]